MKRNVRRSLEQQRARLVVRAEIAKKMDQQGKTRQEIRNMRQKLRSM